MDRLGVVVNYVGVSLDILWKLGIFVLEEQHLTGMLRLGKLKGMHSNVMLNSGMS